MYPTLCVSYFVFIPLRICLTSYIPLPDLTECAPLRAYPIPCVSHSMCPTPISHSQCIPLRAYPIPCVSHSVCILSHVCALLLYLTPCVSHCVYHTPCVSPSCVFHSVSLREYPLCVYPTPYTPNFGCLTPHVCPTSISHSVRIPIRVYPTLCVSHSVCTPHRKSPNLNSTPRVSYSVCPTPCVFHRMSPTLCSTHIPHSSYGSYIPIRVCFLCPTPGVFPMSHSVCVSYIALRVPIFPSVCVSYILIRVCLLYPTSCASPIFHSVCASYIPLCVVHFVYSTLISHSVCVPLRVPLDADPILCVFCCLISMRYCLYVPLLVCSLACSTSCVFYSAYVPLLVCSTSCVS